MVHRLTWPVRLLRSAIFPLFALGVACSGTGDPGLDAGPSGTPNGSACTSASTCASGTCTILPPNQQGRRGMCTEACVGTSACKYGGVCTRTNSNSACLTTCRTSTDCRDGFVCTTSSSGGPRVCGVTYDGRPPEECSTVVNGSCIYPPRRECKEKTGISQADLAKDKDACLAQTDTLWSDGPCPILDTLGGCRNGCNVSATTWYYSPQEGGGGTFGSAEDVKKSCESGGGTFVLP